MRAWRVLLTSVVVHAAAIGLWAWGWERVEPAAVVVPEQRVEVEVVPAKPPQFVEVAFLANAPPSPSPSPVRIRRSSTSTSTSTSTRPGGTSELPATGEGTATRHHGLGMRGPELHPTDEAIAHIAEQPGHQGTTPIASHRLDDAPNGRQVIHDAVTEITVDRDGTAHLHDKPDVDAHVDINPFAWRANLIDAGKAIAVWAENPEADKQYGPTQELPEHLQALPDQCATWGDPMCT
ncbi:MAG TPA: hypothetical protein VIV58_38415, partial [Kofleriaceae bacterium]